MRAFVFVSILFVMGVMISCERIPNVNSVVVAGRADAGGVRKSQLDSAMETDSLVEAAEQTVPVAAKAPWYQEKLEAEGLYVFPEPVDLIPFAVNDLKGNTLDSRTLGGTVTLLNFWATWCPPCKAEMPSIETLSKKLKDEAFRVVAISVQEPRATVASFLSTNQYTFPIYLDESGSVSANYVSRGIPTTFVLDKDARVIAAAIGSLDYASDGMVSVLRELARR